MKRVILCTAVLLACMMTVAAPAVALSSTTTTVSGTIPLTLRQVAASSITCSGAVISWQTNGHSTSEVFYDTVRHDNLADYAHHVESDTLVLTHSLGLSGLSSATSYYYAVKSVLPNNGNSLTAIQANNVFTTLTPGTALTIISPPDGKLPSGEVGKVYSQALAACGGMPDYTWRTIKGCLPSGLSLDASTGVISGTPTEAGMFKFTVQVKDESGVMATQAVRIKIITGPEACFDSLPNGKASVLSTLFRQSGLLVSTCLDSALLSLFD